MSLPKDAAAAASLTPPAQPMGRLARLIQFQAVRIAEQTQQPLDDVQAMRDAHAAHAGYPERLLERAARLAPQLGLDKEMASARERLIVVGLLATLLVGLLSYGLVLSVVGHDRRINAMAALVAVLGPHFFSLALWLLALLTGGTGGGLLKRLLALSTRLPLLGQPSSRLLLQATLDVLARSRGLTVWLFGLMTHLIWALAFVLTLLGLLFAFSFLAYQLTWETTILDGETFARFAQATGRLPALFGFATPAVDHLLEGNGDHRAWAIWLLGCTLIYGLGLRLLLVLLSGLRSGQLLAGLQLQDASDPYVRRLIERFEAMQAVQLLDAESLAAGAGSAAAAAVAGAAHSEAGFRPGLAMIGFELPDTLAWPPLASNVPTPLLSARSDGSVADKRALLDSLHQLAPAQLLLVCNAAASPDRATERFLRAAAAQAGATAVLLAGELGNEALAQRWRDWLAPLPLQAVFADSAAAAAWANLASNSAGAQTHG
ncbi:DUF2868 domain-containing protein [Paucibacter sp. TC2R-5]|uniref:DUF2868 domain-containing protein n=1 Tax=Paucibacter sp. TC2R-5 TaxID=2893555 RepID=UPI0021E4C028|nr:DUF2868 domain-containing protein [Paucibacter sp. TC2R-5]MCV2358541.1 DUF2868 domain-containing protein [Paucibacter sp. TC2R-5]